ncbi:hypothetical protein TNCV_1980921 [Trichonephila clavipes]|nr:hypothetical protein TNCV_1980921 [Trichonephila clavipes]
MAVINCKTANISKTRPYPATAGTWLDGANNCHSCWEAPVNSQTIRQQAESETAKRMVASYGVSPFQQSAAQESTSDLGLPLSQLDQQI